MMKSSSMPPELTEVARVRKHSENENVIQIVPRIKSTDVQVCPC
jgi:hypothetical protein